MNIVFFGSSQFAVSSLKALLNTRHKVSCVVTQPDRQKGRGLHLEGTPVKSSAQEADLQIYQPLKINTPEAVKFLKNFNADLFVVVAYGQILSKEILDIPTIFAINAHASVLPKYRGAAPINWALINGEKTTGVTIMKMTEKMDAGAIITFKTIDILDDDTSVSLEDKLSQLAAQLLVNSLESIENNDYKLTSQDEKKASLAPRLKKEDGLIDWKKPAQVIHNLVRGCLLWPGALTYYNGKLLKIYEAKVIGVLGNQGFRPPGEIVVASKEGIVVATGEDNLVIEELQMEGKKRMRVEEFIAGHKICAGQRFEEKK